MSEKQPDNNLHDFLEAAGHLEPTGIHRRELLAQNGLLAVERVRDPMVTDAIVISIGERARVLKIKEFLKWLDEVNLAAEPLRDNNS